MNNAHADEFKALIHAAGLERKQVAEWLHVSIHTINKWCKPTGTPPPKMAMELLQIKTAQRDAGTQV